MRQIVIDPRVIKHLGRDLITSSEVAVIELVKNAIDAKANNINLRVYNDYWSFETSNIPCLDFIPQDYLKRPLLIVEDDGFGMTDKTIDEGFLRIATDIKSNDSSSLGEKGIGRLAAQRLGSALLVETSSPLEDHTSYLFINWEDVIKGDKTVPSFETLSTRHHTRLWIFGINLEDYIDNPILLQQLVLEGINGSEQAIQINRDLKTALNFLITPFTTNNTASINFYYNNRKIDISFPYDTLNLAESIHHFTFHNDKDKMLSYGLSIKPWFIERVHRALVKADPFKRLKKSHQYYAELLQKNKERIDNALQSVISEKEIAEYLYLRLREFYVADDSSARKDEVYNTFVRQKVDEVLEELLKIAPIDGKIYSFKQGSAIGDKIIIDSAFELKCIDHRYSLNELKQFLEDYNGVKLYRGAYRIGFLGNKENDWIKLQQFRTRGQQWYRFDLGNTVGYVSLFDESQNNVQEISSRLDISENKTSEAFKLLINFIFNYIFYDLNRKANDIVKVLLSERGLLGESLAKRVKKSDSDLREMIRRNKRMQKALQDVVQHLNQAKKINGTSTVALSEKSYFFLAETLKKLDNDIKADSTTQEKTAVLLSEADAQLKSIEVESYNNYKLMANGLITETITHELHSLSKTGITPHTDEHFDFLKDYFVSSHEVAVYNNHVAPIQNSYTNIAGKLEQVSDLYTFLETTFIKKGTVDEFVYQKIFSVISGIKENLKKSIQKERISINCKTGELAWFVPKGVLLHVFFNLINNSIYWIDVRRKWAQSDSHYFFSGKDEIIIEDFDINEILVYDTGPGISRNMEDILFEPLQSGKPFSEGRGMGLYIVRKLLNSFGGEIELLEERNKYGNRFKFLIVNNTSEDNV